MIVPKNFRWRQSQIQGINFFMAEAYRLQNNCYQARGYYNQVIADKENNGYQGRAYLGWGSCLASGGDKVNAEKEFEGAIALNLEDNFVTMHARFELARLFESQQDFKQASKLYMMVGLLYKDPQYGPQALLQAGGLLQKLNETRMPRKRISRFWRIILTVSKRLRPRNSSGKFRER